jgi:hypothetical protein
MRDSGSFIDVFQWNIVFDIAIRRIPTPRVISREHFLVRSDVRGIAFPELSRQN